MKQKGFTLIELMIAVAIVSILAAVALPSYTQYITRSRLVEGTQHLAGYAVTMNQYMQDTGTYQTVPVNGTTCGRTKTSTTYFDYDCSAPNANSFTATMTGKGAMTGYEYTLNYLDVKTTVKPTAWAKTDCWNTGSTCIN